MGNSEKIFEDFDNALSHVDSHCEHFKYWNEAAYRDLCVEPGFLIGVDECGLRPGECTKSWIWYKNLISLFFKSELQWHITYFFASDKIFVGPVGVLTWRTATDVSATLAILRDPRWPHARTLMNVVTKPHSVKEAAVSITQAVSRVFVLLASMFPLTADFALVCKHLLDTRTKYVDIICILLVVINGHLSIVTNEGKCSTRSFHFRSWWMQRDRNVRQRSLY